jgi:nucleotide-binding universal stress UspA family protein
VAYSADTGCPRNHRGTLFAVEAGPERSGRLSNLRPVVTAAAGVNVFVTLLQTVGVSKADYRVAVAVDRREQVEQLARTARDLADEYGGDVLVVSVAVQPPESPFAVFRDDVIRREFSGDRQELLDRAVAATEATGVDVEGRLVIARSVAVGLLDAVAEYDCDALLMGWHARRRRNIVMGHIVDRVVAAAPCDVLVETVGATADGVERLLVPAGDDPHTGLAADAARAVARANDAHVDVVRVVPPEASDVERAAARDLAADVVGRLEEVAGDAAVVEGDDVVEALVSTAEDHDVTSIGGGRGGWLRRRVVGSTSRRVGRRAGTTVIVAHRGRSRPRSWLARLRGLAGR